LNYEFIDTIVFKKVSPSHALVGYSNSESQKMANFDIVFKFRSKVVYEYSGYLSEYAGVDNFTYIPNKGDDMFHTSNKLDRVTYTQTKDKKSFYSAHLDSNIEINLWDIQSHKNGKCTNAKSEYLHPVRVQDWVFTLLNNHK
jgi:hypothetical protein